MTLRFCLKPLKLALCLAFPGGMLSAWAATLPPEPYPALPPTLSTSVAPNVLLMVDNSGSMKDKPNPAATSSKMDSAKKVSNALVAANPALRWGLFSFDLKAGSESGVLLAPVGSDASTMKTAIDALYAATWTPLGETMFEITRYFAGESSYYGKTKNTLSGTYESPIQYRCQKNFTIIVTDGDSSYDNKLPGTDGNPAINYTSYDASNVAVTRPFKACVSNTNVSPYLTCPLKLETSTVTNPFTSTESGGVTTYPRSLRDVAMYAYDRDFKVTGNGADKDADGKSWDDPKFLKQNIQTYTVGFAVNNSVLQSTAEVGKGKYYTVDKEADLLAALQNAVDSIVASISNGGGLATVSSTSSGGNRIFQPVFNPTNWSGELRCFTLINGDKGPACTPNAKALIPATGRKLYTSKVVSKATTPSTAFDFVEGMRTTMTPSQQASLGAEATEQENTIRFIRGNDAIPGLRSRAGNLLGDIVDGQPIVVTKPGGATPDAAYAAFATANAARNLVLVGANDGMMHTFKIEDMSELMGYVPSAVYPRLKALTAADYGKNPGTPHSYHVNGVMKQRDFKLGSTWKTIVVGGLGQGGQGYYALDATDETQLGTATKAVKWEFTDVNDAAMGYTLGAPLLYNVRASATTVTPAVIFANGYENTWDDVASGGKIPSPVSPATLPVRSALFILNADNGAVIKRIDLPVGSTGLSSPVGVDVGQDGILDYVYAGDINGKLWRFDLTDANPSKFDVIKTPIFDAGIGQPIMVRPVTYPVKKTDGSALGNLVMFGTGKLLTNADRADLTTQTLYGILDTMELSPTTVPKSSLQQQTFDTATATIVDPPPAGYRPGTYRKVSQNTIDLTSTTNTQLGWYLNLPNSSERQITTPVLMKDMVLFGTGVPVAAEKCLPGGTGWIIGLNPLTGSITKKDMKATGKTFSFIDVKLDGRSTTADKVSFSSGSEYASAFSLDGIPTELSVVSVTNPTLTTPNSTNTGYGDAGSVLAMTAYNDSGVFQGNDGLSTSPSGGRGGGGNAMGAPTPPCNANMYSGTIGSDTIAKNKLNCAGGDAARIETSTWREIK